MITIAICDDEPVFINDLQKSVKQYFSIHHLEHQIFEFIDGMEVIERLRSEKKKRQVIFITSYQRYALQAFHVDAVHYLLKPVSSQKLNQALERSMFH